MPGAAATRTATASSFAYSEDLHKRFAENLGGFAAPGDLSIGEAMVLAKQDYLGELGLVGVYDEKASSEFTLYGLPMWQIGGAGAAAASAPCRRLDPGGDCCRRARCGASRGDRHPVGAADQELVVEPSTGLTAEQLTTDWTPPPATAVEAPGRGSFVSGLDGVQVTHFRPVEPKTVLPVTVPSAHGALIMELSSSSITPFVPYFARPIVDSRALEPQLDWDRLVHPAKIQTVTTSKLGTTKRHRLVLATGQFTGPPGGGEAGTQRLFRHIQALVFSAPSNDYAKPILGRVSATKVGANVAFSVETRDQTPNGPNDVVRVRVGYLDQPDGSTTRAWKFLDLVRTPSTDRWSGSGPLVNAIGRLPVLRPVGGSPRQRRRLDEQGRLLRRGGAASAGVRRPLDHRPGAAGERLVRRARASDREARRHAGDPGRQHLRGRRRHRLQPVHRPGHGDRRRPAHGHGETAGRLRGVAHGADRHRGHRRS